MSFRTIFPKATASAAAASSWADTALDGSTTVYCRGSIILRNTHASASVDFRFGEEGETIAVAAGKSVEINLGSDEVAIGAEKKIQAQRTSSGSAVSYQIIYCQRQSVA